MERIVVTAVDEMTGQSETVGWFDLDRAERFEEQQDWNGNNHVGRMSGLQAGYEDLLRTAGGRWVVHHNGRNEFNGPEYFEFLTDAQARDWLIRNGSDDVIEKYLGPIEDERGPGRPSIDGDPINFKPGAELLARVDAYAKAGEMTRADALRMLLAAGLDAKGAHQ